MIQNIRTIDGIKPHQGRNSDLLSISIITAIWPNIVMKERGFYRFVNARFGSVTRSMRGIMTFFTKGLNR